MDARAIKIAAVTVIGGIMLGGCVSNVAVYESPTAGPVATITLVNDAQSQVARVATFDDGRSCTRRRHIQFSGGEGIAPGESLSVSVAAGNDFSLFAALDRISSDEYGVDVGMTGGGPGPVITPTVTALNCNVIVTFDVEQGREYRVSVSEAETTRSCAIEVAKIGGGNSLPVKFSERVARFPRNELGSFCE